MRIVHKQTNNETTKYLQKVGDYSIETTYVNRPEKHIICFSSQVGCAVRCAFCAARNLKNSLTRQDMFQQCKNVINDQNIHDTKPILFTAMGEGEPLFNDYTAEAVCSALYD